MKKIRHIILSILIYSGLSGCSSFLDVDIPDALLDKDYWKTRDQIEAALYGTYTQLGKCVTLFLPWGDARSNLYSRNISEANKDQIINQDILPTNTFADWGPVYTAINFANSFIQNAHRVRDYDITLSATEVNNMIGEMYGVRALCYFYLVRTFKEVPLYMQAYESDKQNPSAPAVSETTALDTIESDLKKALNMAPEDFPDRQNNYGRITRKAIKALWADVKLWRGDYTGCITLCEELEKEFAGKMELPENWFNMFGEGNSTESIFEYQFSNNGIKSPLGTYFAYAYTARGQAVFAANFKGYRKDMQKVYTSDGNRMFSDTIRTYGATIGAQGFNNFDVYKYMGITKGYEEYQFRDAITVNDAHFIFYRFREILLMKAEALAMTGKFSEALVPINEIRKATGLEETTPAKFGTGEMFFDKLLCERVAELAFEGKQWFSMVRIARHTGYRNLLTDRVADAHLYLSSLVVKARLQDEEGWFFPYLEDEVTKNQLLEQKEFYKGKN